MRGCVRRTPVGSSKVTLAGHTATVELGKFGVVATVRLETKPEYFALQVSAVQGEGVQWLQLCNLHLNINGSVGPLVNAAWEET
jgi:hypothetical protein